MRTGCPRGQAGPRAGVSQYLSALALTCGCTPSCLQAGIKHFEARTSDFTGSKRGLDVGGFKGSQGFLTCSRVCEPPTGSAGRRARHSCWHLWSRSGGGEGTGEGPTDGGPSPQQPLPLLPDGNNDALFLHFSKGARSLHFYVNSPYV